MKKYSDDNKKNTNNDRLKVREMTDMQMRKGNNDHSRNLDRILMERGDFFEQNSNTQNDVDDNGRLVFDKNDKKSNSKFGEITGDTFNPQDMDRGLPVRSQYTKKKQHYDQNEHLDFDLFDDRPSTLNVNNFDPSSTQGSLGAGFADIPASMTKMSTQLNPISICSSQIDKLNNTLFYFLFDLYDNSYMTNGYGLFNLFASLFFSANGMTEIELKKFFDFPKRDELYTGLIKINKAVESIEKMINFKNFIIIGNDVPYDPHYHDAVKEFCVLVRVDVTKPIAESKKLNEIIKRIMGTELRNVVTPENLDKLQLMLLTTCVVHPIWAIPFDRITKGIFHGFKYDEKLDYLHSISKEYGYFEDNDHQLLEIKCAGNELVMGFILHKETMRDDVDNIKLHFCISHMKESILDEIKIPLFKGDFKIRYNNTLQSLNLVSVFTKMICPKFFPESIVLQDVVQNIRIVIDDTHQQTQQNQQKESRGHRTNRRFICDKPFMYYFRLVKTNTILLSGIYQ